MQQDFNDAGPQKSFDVIPAGTVATLQLKITPGSAGPDAWLKRSKAGDSESLDCELCVIDGAYAKRKFWSLMLVAGVSEGHAKAADITRRKLRGILESAYGVKPDDTSDAAKQARTIASYAELDGLRFIGRIGIEPAKDGFPAKNTLLEAITPDQKEWHRAEQVAASSNGTTAAGAPAAASAKAPAQIVRPTWATK